MNEEWKNYHYPHEVPPLNEIWKCRKAALEVKKPNEITCACGTELVIERENQISSSSAQDIFNGTYTFSMTKETVAAAVKEIDYKKDRDRYLRYCQKDVSSMKKLGGDHVVRLYDFKDLPFWDTLIIVMEKCEGNIEDFVKTYKGNNYHDIMKSVMRQLIAAGYYMHSQQPQILHLDLQPKNILVVKKINNGKVEDLDVKISHFLFSKIKREDGNYSRVSDSDHPSQAESCFMSNEFLKAKVSSETRPVEPNRIDENQLGPAADVFSLGCTLYYLKTYSESCKEGLFKDKEAVEGVPTDSDRLEKSEIEEMLHKKVDEERDKKLDKMAKMFPLEADLIKRMTSRNPGNRDTLETLASHPALWEPERFAHNLCTFHRLIVDKGQCLAAIDLQENSLDILGLDWFFKLPKQLRLLVEKLNDNGEGRYKKDIEKFKSTADIMSLIRILRNWLEHHESVFKFGNYDSCYDMVKKCYPNFTTQFWSLMVKHGRFNENAEFIGFKEESLKKEDKKKKDRNDNSVPKTISVTIDNDLVLKGTWRREPKDKIVHGGLYSLKEIDGFNSIYEATCENIGPVAVHFLDVPERSKAFFKEETNKLQNVSAGVIKVHAFKTDVLITKLFKTAKTMIVTEKIDCTLEDSVKKYKGANFQESAIRQLTKAYKELHDNKIVHQLVNRTTIAVTEVIWERGKEKRNFEDLKLKLCGFPMPIDDQFNLSSDIFNLGCIFHFLLPNLNEGQGNAVKETTGFQLMVESMIKKMTDEDPSKRPKADELSKSLP